MSNCFLFPFYFGYTFLIYILANLVCIDASPNYCNLPCLYPFTGAKRTNSACTCSVGVSCGSDFAILQPNFMEQSYILDVHNEYRDRFASGNDSRNKEVISNMRALIYDENLEYVAQCYANKCVPRYDECRRTEKFQLVGQNFYVSYGNNICKTKNVFRSAVQAWYGEITEMTVNCLKYYSGCAGHFTQLVWAETTNLGCGRVLFADTCHIICNYGPAGNTIGQPVYKPGIPICRPDMKYTNLCQSSLIQFWDNSNMLRANYFLIVTLAIYGLKLINLY